MVNKKRRQMTKKNKINIILEKKKIKMKIKIQKKG